MPEHDLDDGADAAGRRKRTWSRRTLLRRLALYPLGGAAALAAGGVVFHQATLYRAGDPQRGTLALTGANVLAGAELEPAPDATVVIRDGVITDVGSEAEVPAGADVVDVGGRTLLPGLIDLHVHFGTPAQGSAPGVLAIPRLVADLVRLVPDRRRELLEHGVTAVRSLGDEYAWICDMRSQLADGTLEGPRLFAAGPIFTTPGGHPVATFGSEPESDFVRVPLSPDEARRTVRALAQGDDRVDLIKVVQERGDSRRPLEPFAPEMLRAIVDEAHEQGLPVVVHWGTIEDLEDALAAGVDGLEHLETRGPLQAWPSEVLDVLVERQVPLSPTLAVTEAAPAVSAEDHRQLRLRAGEYHAAGGRITVGTDPPLQGVPFGAGVHRELELLVDGGLTPQQALRAATSEAARALGAGHIGAVEPGRAADLLVVDGDPLDRISATRDVVLVLRDGRLVVDNRGEV